MRADLNIPIGPERLSRLMLGFDDPTIDDVNGLLAWIDLHQPVEGHDEYEFKMEIKKLKLDNAELKKLLGECRDLAKRIERLFVVEKPLVSNKD